MKNVQISFDEGLLEEVDEISVSSRLSRSAIVREALRLWIRRREAREFEAEWIEKLREKPADRDRDESEAWLAAESWSDE